MELPMIICFLSTEQDCMLERVDRFYTRVFFYILDLKFPQMVAGQSGETGARAESSVLRIEQELVQTLSPLLEGPVAWMMDHHDWFSLK